MNFASRFASHACLFVLLALCLHQAAATDYGVAVILPRTGGLDNTLYNASMTAARIAANDISQDWLTTHPGDTFSLVLQDSGSIGATSMRMAYDAAQNTSIMAVIGSGPDNMTLPTAQLLFNWDVRASPLSTLSMLRGPDVPCSLAAHLHRAPSWSTAAGRRFGLCPQRPGSSQSGLRAAFTALFFFSFSLPQSANPQSRLLPPPPGSNPTLFDLSAM